MTRERTAEPRRQVLPTKDFRFELRACDTCGAVVAHRLADGLPHELHVRGARHRDAAAGRGQTLA